jgi:hypothetical protein
MKLSDEQVLALLQELDRIAQHVCTYDYGLPLFNEEAMPLMVAAVQRAVGQPQVEVTEDDGEPD